MNRFLANILLLSVICSLPDASAVADMGPRHPSFYGCLDFDRAACNDVVAAEPDNLTAHFMRGLAAELEGDHRAALVDFSATVMREPRHFGAQLWRHVSAVTIGEADFTDLRAYLDKANLPPWPKVLAELYLGAATPETAIALAEAQNGPARAEALCAVYYHIGRIRLLAGDTSGANESFRAAVVAGTVKVFEYRAAERALWGKP